MNRNFKILSVIIIQLIMGLVGSLINRLLGINPNSIQEGANVTMGFLPVISWFLTMLINSITGFMIASGLLRNRFGSVGEYFNQINHFSAKAFGVLLVIQILLALIVVLVVGLLSPLFFGPLIAAINSMDFTNSSLLIFGILVLLVTVFVTVFSYYAYFVVAEDHKNYGFGELIGKTFRTGQDLFGQSLVVLMKYLLIPLLIYFIIVIFAFRNESIAVFEIVTIAFAVFMAYASAMVYGEISNLYIDYRGADLNTNNEELDERARL